MELALGTVQFGIRYGVAGRDTPVPESEVRDILKRAWSMGIRTLDTAAAYGDIESRLQRLSEGNEFQVVTKLPAMPAELPVGEVALWIAAALAAAHQKLGPLLQAVMFHRTDDLMKYGVFAWEPCERFSEKHPTKLGVSCYGTDELQQLAERHPLAISQLPANAFDQSITLPNTLPPNVQVYVRSAFLQGLLLMPVEKAIQRVPAATHALIRWHKWCETRALKPLTAALGMVKGMSGVSHCVVGVDCLAQLEAIAEAWTQAPTLRAPELATHNSDVTDPRRWPTFTSTL